MKRLSLALSLFLFAGSTHMLAQQSVRGQYEEAVAAFQRGDSAAVIRLLEPTVRSNELQDAELGRAWALLGSSYKAEAKYSPAQQAYDRAIPLLEGDPLSVKDYAAVLREAGAVYREMGDFGPAEKLQRESLQLSEKNHDHAAIARACAGLSELSLDRQRLKDGERYIACAESESQLTNEFDDDDRAYMAQVQGWISLKRGDVRTSISDYQRSIDLFSGRYGENFALTGWAYILLAKAYVQGGMQDKALEAMHEGVTILGRTLGTHDPRYASAEVLYAGVLNKTGQHSVADKLKAEGEATLREVRQAQCAGCTMNVAAFR